MPVAVEPTRPGEPARVEHRQCCFRQARHELVVLGIERHARLRSYLPVDLTQQADGSFHGNAVPVHAVTLSHFRPTIPRLLCLFGLAVTVLLQKALPDAAERDHGKQPAD